MQIKLLNTLLIERIRLVYIKVKKINNKVILPTYETSSSAGMDIRAFLPNGKVIIPPKETKLIGTGLFFETICFVWRYPCKQITL